MSFKNFNIHRCKVSVGALVTDPYRHQCPNHNTARQCCGLGTGACIHKYRTWYTFDHEIFLSFSVLLSSHHTCMSLSKFLLTKDSMQSAQSLVNVTSDLHFVINPLHLHL